MPHRRFEGKTSLFRSPSGAVVRLKSGEGELWGAVAPLPLGDGLWECMETWASSLESPAGDLLT